MTSEVFREFFFNEKLDFKNLGEDTIVIFDTNTLLNIYRYSNDTRAKLIEAIKQIRNNIWMPYQVGLEFNLNRRGVIEKLKNGQEKQKQDIHKTVEKNINVLTQYITNVSLKSTDAKSKKSEINDFIKEKLLIFNDELAGKVEELYGMLDLEEDLASEIATIFDGKIGECYTQEQLNEKLKDAATRYERKIPPGYKDSEKIEVTYYNGIEFEQKYGDLIVWNQILDRANVDEINKVVFVTDDNKEDWWYSLERKTIGPRAELKNEMRRVAKADFYMLNANGFLNNFSESDNTKDLIENDEAPKSRLENPIFMKQLKAAMKAINGWSPDLSVVEQDKGIGTVTSVDLDSSSLESYEMYNERNSIQDLQRVIVELEEQIHFANRQRRRLINSLRENESKFNKLVSDGNAPAILLENLSTEIQISREKLDVIYVDLIRMQSKYTNYMRELNKLNELN